MVAVRGGGLTLGIDSGTQSVKLVVCDERGSVAAAASAPHPTGCVQPPEAWWEALVAAANRLPVELRNEVAAVSVGAQQHGCVALGPGPERRVLAPASLWCDTSSAPEAARLNGLADFAAEVGSRLVASFTITKLGALPPETDAVCLPHDWLSFRLTGRLASDRGDASGTGWWSPSAGVRRDLLELAGRANLAVPEVLGPEERLGVVTADAAGALGLPAGIAVGPGTGDNMAAALGIGLAEGEAAVSLGTSGTVFVRTPVPTHDSSGLVAGFADATGAFLPLVCTLNCTRPVQQLAGWFGLGLSEALALARRETSVVMLPYLIGERTPDLPQATGAVVGLTDASEPADLLAAAVGGAAFGLASGLDAIERCGVPPPPRLRLVGGGAQHPTWGWAVARAGGRAVEVLPDGVEFAARGMAAQARAVLDGCRTGEVAAAWRPDATRVEEPDGAPPAGHAGLLQALRPLWR